MLHPSKWGVSGRVQTRKIFTRGSGKGSSSSISLASYAAKPPSKDQPSWKRLAEQIKGEGGDSEVTGSVYMARLRVSHDQRDHVEKIEQEVLEEMAGALGRSGDKCNYHFFILERQGKVCDAASAAVKDAVESLQQKTLVEIKEMCRVRGLSVSGSKAALIHYLLDPDAPKGRGLSHDVDNHRGRSTANLAAALASAVAEFNRLRGEADKARRELIIHRQAIGFQTGNYKAIEKAWPLPSLRRVEKLEAAEIASEADAEAERNRKWLERMESFSRRR